MKQLKLHWKHRRGDRYHYYEDAKSGWGHVLKITNNGPEHGYWSASGPSTARTSRTLKAAKAFVERDVRAWFAKRRKRSAAAKRARVKQTPAKKPRRARDRLDPMLISSPLGTPPAVFQTAASARAAGLPGVMVAPAAPVGPTAPDTVSSTIDNGPIMQTLTVPLPATASDQPPGTQITTTTPTPIVVGLSPLGRGILAALGIGLVVVAVKSYRKHHEPA